MANPRLRSWQLLVFVLVLHLDVAISHPNCVQPVGEHIFPPIPNPPLSYCGEYGTNSDGACCTATSEIPLAKLPAETVLDFASTNAAIQACAPYVKDIYCTWCNPYSGHNYESESGNGHRPGPWICSAFCGRFWQSCSHILFNTTGPSSVGSTMRIPGLSADMGVTSLADHFASEADYCAIYGSNNPGSCYTDNPQELVTVPGGASIPMVTELAYPNILFNAQTVPVQNPAWSLRITHILVAPGTNRMFACFQHGVVLSWVDSEASNIFNVVIDMQSSTYFDNGGGSEYGVMGIGFHPNFLQNGWMYFKHSHQTNRDRLVRVTVDLATWTADPASMLTIFDYEMFGVMHHGSPPIFGSDGMMYMANGDGTNYFENGKAYNPAQDPSSLLGKVLRVNVDASSAAVPYTVPVDNPFVGMAGWAPEVWAYGFRNPWRISFDGVSGRFWLGNVGQTMFESVYVVERGKFHGWHTREAYNCYYPTASLIGAPFLDCITPDEVLPILEFSHDASYCAIVSNPAHCKWPSIMGNAVIGGFVYRGAKNPSIWGSYIFANYQPDFSAYVYTANFDAANPSNIFSIWRIAPIYPPGHDPNNWSISTLGEDSNGEILIVNINNANEILKFAPDGAPAPPGSVPAVGPNPPSTPSATNPIPTPSSGPVASPRSGPSTPSTSPSQVPGANPSTPSVANPSASPINTSPATGTPRSPSTMTPSNTIQPTSSSVTCGNPPFMWFTIFILAALAYAFATF